MGPRGWIRVSEVVCRVLRQRNDRGEAREGYWDCEWRRGFFGREPCGTLEELPSTLCIPSDATTYRWKGELKTSVQDTERNAVTWGVFPGQEIVQSTIIEQESFLTWKVRIPTPFS